MQPTSPTEPSTNPQPATPKKSSPRRRCRFIKTDGLQCGGPAVTDSPFCWQHDQHRRPRLTGVAHYDEIPLLEDPASIQLCISQTIQGVMDGVCSESRARTIFYGCSVANQSLRQQLARDRFDAEQKRPTPEPVSEIHKSPEFCLAPEQTYKGPTGAFEPQWSLSKYRYEQECERLGIPKPTCAEEYPPSGWLTEDEIKEDPNDFCDRYEARIRTLREQKEQREENQQKCDPSRQAQQERGGTAQQEQSEKEEQQQRTSCHPEQKPCEGKEPCVSSPGLDLQATADPAHTGHLRPCVSRAAVEERGFSPTSEPYKRKRALAPASLLPGAASLGRCGITRSVRSSRRVPHSLSASSADKGWESNTPAPPTNPGCPVSAAPFGRCGTTRSVRTSRHLPPATCQVPQSVSALSADKAWGSSPLDQPPGDYFRYPPHDLTSNQSFPG